MYIGIVAAALLALVSCTKGKLQPNSPMIGHWGCEQYVSCRTDSLGLEQWDTLRFEAVSVGNMPAVDLDVDNQKDYVVWDWDNDGKSDLLVCGISGNVGVKWFKWGANGFQLENSIQKPACSASIYRGKRKNGGQYYNVRLRNLRNGGKFRACKRRNRQKRRGS